MGRVRRSGRVPAQPVDLADLRKLNRRRNGLSKGTRRLLPGVIVGSASLIGTGGLVVWVGDRPGMKPTTVATSYRPPVSTGRSDPTVVAALQAQLQADEREVQRLGSTYGSATRHAASPARSSSDPSARTGPKSGPATSSNPTPEAGPNAGSGPSTESIAVPTVEVPGSPSSGGTAAGSSSPPVTSPVASPAPTPTTPPVTTAPTPPPVQTTTGASHAVP
jgi:hypothetical protein